MLGGWARGGRCYIPSTGKSSNSSSSSSRAVLVCVGFDVAAGSAVVDLEGCSFAVGVVEDMLIWMGREDVEGGWWVVTLRVESGFGG